MDGRLHVAEIRFEAQNGEEGVFTEGVECFDNDVPITEQFKNQGQCIKFTKDNPESGITEEDCKNCFS